MVHMGWAGDLLVKHVMGKVSEFELCLVSHPADKLYLKKAQCTPERRTHYSKWRSQHTNTCIHAADVTGCQEQGKMPDTETH